MSEGELEESIASYEGDDGACRRLACKRVSVHHSLCCTEMCV